MTQPLNYSLDFDQKLSPEAERGMADADAHAKVEWKRVIDGLILNCAFELEEFTVDDVIERFERLPFPPRTHRLCAIGPRMKEVSKTLKYMTATDQVVRGKRPISKGNFHRVWRSNVFGTNISNQSGATSR